LARFDLARLRVAVAGRPAFDDVRHEHLPAVQPDLAQQLVQQLPGLAHEGQALTVLVGPRRLADEHEVRVRVAVAEHHRGAAVGQRAARALPGLEPDLLERLAPLRRSRHAPSLAAAGDGPGAAYAQTARGIIPYTSTCA